MKRCIVYWLLLSLVLTMLPFGVLASETEEMAAIREPGQCGENLSWHFDGGTLTISGSGEMDDFEEGGAPWQEHKDSITKVVLSGSVASVGAHAFTDYDTIEAVEFGNALHTIGYRAFKSCDNLTRIILPDTFRKFDEECFMGCKRLGEIWCRGGMPSFKASCVWDVHATIFYPPAKAWPAEYVIPLGDAFRWQIQFQTMDVPEEYLTPAAEPVVTEPVQTEPAVTAAAETQPPETVPETTEAATEPATEATEPAVTETVPETEETKPAWMEEMEQLEKEQAEEQIQPEEKSGIGIGMIVGICIFSGILVLVLIGALVFRRRSY